MKSNCAHEVEILRFFEEAPLERVSVVFNIVSEKVRLRLGQSAEGGEGTKSARAKRRGATSRGPDDLATPKVPE